VTDCWEKTEKQQWVYQKSLCLDSWCSRKRFPM